MPRLSKARVISALLLLLVVILFFAQAQMVRHLAGMTISGSRIEYSAGDLWQGQAMVKLQTPWINPWVDIQWQWCPGLNPLRWCTNLVGTDLDGVAKVAVGISGLAVTDAQLSVQHLPVKFSPLIRMTTAADTRITSADWSYGEHLPESVESTVLLSSIVVMGQSLRPVRLQIDREDADKPVMIEVKGEDISGSITLQGDGKYVTTARLTPEPELADMLAQVLTPTQPGVFDLEERGVVRALQP